MNSDRLIKNFSRCIDWEDKYLYIISLGEKFACLPPEEQVPGNAISGCQSKVWITVNVVDGKIELAGNSDAALVKGLVAMVIIVLSGKTPDQLLETDIKKIFADMGLALQLTPARNQGLESMIRTIYSQVQALS
ncbi:SufE family protein [Veronia pacifica]|uniref:Cysteine desufuration protein SufE n=1 Tax=Veronia pacifica TaxID=1080227 RepID=A0A1C3EC37_9GAMM|nr:SufE family protein [Veronia pacifica]ODA30817.1 cysteine desufuration protein SufE [Veronia pacifica]